MIENVEISPNERQLLYNRFANKLEIAYNLNRKIVSFQANKDEPIYRWFKYKEGFSSALVKYFLSEYASKTGTVLDPFAGAGTTLFGAQELGWDSFGIELLPVGSFVIQTRQALNALNLTDFKRIVKRLWTEIDQMNEYSKYINHISITKDAFSDETEILLNKYLTFCSSLKDENCKTLLRFAAFSILEEISYTRKDGQYLRWDFRSKRKLSGKPFNKGIIYDFKTSLNKKINQIISDLSHKNENLLFELNNHKHQPKNNIQVLAGSCLDELPKLKNGSFDFVITSPPYCNRYDYTRTYALELVFLGNDNDDVRDLRQKMLSCTVENKEKIQYLEKIYTNLGRENDFKKILEVYYDTPAMIEVNAVLDNLNKLNELNNSNIARMVKNYFLEMCFVICEMARILQKNGHCVMVNDNVRYGGEEIPVDLILSAFAEKFGFEVKKIFVLPRGKGNSSQQMGNFGRSEVRKCVYLWQKK